DSSRLANPDFGSDFQIDGVLESLYIALQEVECTVSLFPDLKLSTTESTIIERIAVDTSDIHKDFTRDESSLQAHMIFGYNPFEAFFFRLLDPFRKSCSEKHQHIVFVASCLVRWEGQFPHVVHVGFAVLHEFGNVDVQNPEIRGDRLRKAIPLSAEHELSARQSGHIPVARGIDKHLRQYKLSPGLRLNFQCLESITFPDRLYRLSMQQNLDPGIFYCFHHDPLHGLGIECSGVGAPK